MLKASDRLKRLSESATLKMAEMSRELAAKGVDVISLSVGQPDFKTPKHIREAAKKAIEGDFDGYSPVQGYLDLREAICIKLKRDSNLDYTPDQIVVSTGAKQSLANIFHCFLDEGDEVIIPAPYWVSYPEQVGLCNAKSVFIKTNVEGDFKITPAQLEEAITPKTKFLVYSSPCNPTGSVYNGGELSALGEVLKKHPHVYVISDEIYEHINYVGNHASIAQIPFLKDRTIVVNGQAKGYAMPGWRIGYIAAPTYIAEACTKFQGQTTSGTNTIAQRATVEALLGDHQPTYTMREAFKRRRDLVLKMIDEIPDVKCTVPEGAFYVFPDVSAYFGKKYQGQVIRNSDDLCMFLLNVGHVAVVAGSGFGVPECIRFSYAASDDTLREALTRVQHAFKLLQ